MVIRRILTGDPGDLTSGRADVYDWPDPGPWSQSADVWQFYEGRVVAEERSDSDSSASAAPLDRLTARGPPRVSMNMTSGVARVRPFGSIQAMAVSRVG